VTESIETAPAVDTVEFFFDPMCPWAYQGSRWIREVRTRRGVEIHWRFFSLEEVNRPEGKRHPWERPWAWGWSQMRVGALLRRESQDAIDRWYRAVGAAFFERGEPTQERAVHERVVVDAGFPRDVVAEAIADPSTTDEVRADHEWAVERGGFGVPILAFPDETIIFGPNVAPAPRGNAAARLWDLVIGWREFDHLYEIRRPKLAADWEHLAGLFAPYLDARSWETIQRPVA